MLREYKAIAGQSAYDVCTLLYGSLDNLIKLCSDSGLENIDTPDLSGYTFIYDTTLVSNQALQSVLSSGNYGTNYTTPDASCTIVTGVTNSAADVDELTFTWAVNLQATGYQYALTSSSTEPTTGWINTTANTAIITGLLSNTNYFFHIRTVCNPGSFSAVVTVSGTTDVVDLELWISPWLDPDVTNPSPGNFMEYGITDISIDTGTLTVVIPAIALYTEAEEDAYLLYLNSGAFPLLTGTFTRTSGVFKYIAGVGESPSIFGDVAALYKKMVFDVKFDIGYVDFGFIYRRTPTTPSKMVIDYVDGNVVSYTNPASGMQTVTHSFDGVVSGGVKNVQVFHNDQIWTIEFTENGILYPATAEIVDITGDSPLNLIAVAARVAAQIITFNFDFSLLSLLQGVTFQNNTALKSVPDLFQTAHPAFESLFCDDNNFDRTETDRIINDFVANSWDGTTAITMRITNTPAAAPTAASLAARTAMLAEGCTLTFDP